MKRTAIKNSKDSRFNITRVDDKQPAPDRVSKTLEFVIEAVKAENWPGYKIAFTLVSDIRVHSNLLGASIGIQRTVFLLF